MYSTESRQLNRAARCSPRGTYFFSPCIARANPPYMEQTESDSTRMPPLYNSFMDESFKVGEKVELISPYLFLS